MQTSTEFINAEQQVLQAIKNQLWGSTLLTLLEDHSHFIT